MFTSLQIYFIYLGLFKSIILFVRVANLSRLVS